MLGLDGELGSIEVGKKADIVGLDGSLSVQLSMSEGTIRYKGVNNA
jgi:N-acetylglucosamine-6-phosphate deacetylase